MKLLILALFLVSAYSANWAVIIAGSSGYENYRHQADTCHAYQTLINKGIPASNIINLAYDDIANNYENPIPGSLYNAPSEGAGWNVYDGCKFDYTEDQVTPENYVNVITGNAAGLQGIGTGRFLNSTENDDVFLYFADHGGPGILGFPQSFFYKKTLENALEKMHKKKMFKQLVFYVEACESGSMFTGFPSDLNIYVMTAADPSQSSWGCYCPPDDYVNGQEINSCLGDTFSVNWLQNTDKTTTSQETLEKQWKTVKEETTRSNVSQWGDKSFTNEVIGKFVGMGKANKFLVLPNQEIKPSQFSSQESQYLIRINYLKRQMEKNPDNYEKKIAYEKEVLLNSYFDSVFGTISMMAGVPEAVQTREYPPITEDDCFIELFEEFSDKCVKLTDYALQYTRVFIHMCEKKTGQDLKKIVGDACQAYSGEQ